MSKQYNVAVVGATGAVGEVMIELLHERRFPVAKLSAVASSRSAGSRVTFGNRSIVVETLEGFDFSDVDIALFSPGSSVSAIYAPKAAAQGCIVIDNTSEFRYRRDIPLVVPEVNPESLAEYKNCNIIANPNCSTIQMVVALKPIYDAVGIERINVCTYQAVSVTGNEALYILPPPCQSHITVTESQSRIEPMQVALILIQQTITIKNNRYTQQERQHVR